MKPIFLKSESEIPRGAVRTDTTAAAKEELFVVRNPHFFKKEFKKSAEWKTFLSVVKDRSCWVYFPWNNCAVRILDEELYFEARTARNKSLITREEQEAYRNAKVGIAGLSVGSSVLSALVLTGGPKNLRLADFDTLAPTNMNRIRSGIRDIGRPKIDLAAEAVWDADPYADLVLYKKGLTEETLEKFIGGPAPLDIFIDEMDNLMLKVAARIVARRNRIPVLMATDNADSIILDVERFDEDPKLPLFHGLAGNLTMEKARNATGKKWFALVRKIIGEQYMPDRLKVALGEVGKSLAGVPQLGTDAMASGAIVSLAARKIANHMPLRSGRYAINMENVLREPVHHS